MTAENLRTKSNHLVFFFGVVQTVAFVFAFLLLISGCGHSNLGDQKLSLTIGFDEDWNIKTYCDGAGWRGMSKWTTWMQTNEDGVFNISFRADKNYSNVGNGAALITWALSPTNTLNVLQQRESNNAAIWIRGTLQPLDTNWDYFSCSLKFSSKVPVELTFFGFQNTNNIQTNEDGTVFNFNAGETNISFTGKVDSVFEKQESKFHKKF